MKYGCTIIYLIAITLLIACNEHTDKVSSRPKLASDANVLKNEIQNPYEPVDISPMDMSYLPNDYPILKMNNKTKKLPVARVIYSRPQMQGRKIFGSIVKYGEPWRLGANEATEIQLFQPVNIKGKEISAGRYVLYCIPQPNQWTIVFNSNFDCWGLKQDTTKDLYRFSIPTIHKDQAIEYFTMAFKDSSNSSANLIMAWENIEARLPIQYKK